MTFNDALDHFKTTAAIAAALGMSERRVQEWKNTGFDRRTQLALQAASKGALKADKP